MIGLVERVDAWCRRGDYTVTDLGRYRIIYGLIALMSMRTYGNIADQPQAQFDPPPGPIMVFSSIPSRAALEALEVAVAILVVFLIIGFRTKTASLLLALALMTGAGLTYSFGKIDHGIFIVLVPAAMAFSGWGGSLSVDAHLRARAGRPPAEPSQWALRLLALMIGLAFLTGGLAKLTGGWLDPRTHAARGHFVEKYVQLGRDDYLAPLFLRVHDVGLLWEALDWFTVALECGLVFAVLWWRTFRIGVAFAALFHLGVLLVMNIQFGANTVAYGAFVRWGLIPPTGPGPVLPLNGLAATVLGLGLGAAAYALNGSGAIPSIGGRRLLIAGALVAVVYLVVQVRLSVGTASKLRSDRASARSS